MINIGTDWRGWKLDPDCPCDRCEPFNTYNKLVNNEGKTMEQINTTPIEAPKPALTDEELNALLAQGLVVSTDDADETDEEKVLN